VQQEEGGKSSPVERQDKGEKEAGALSAYAQSDRDGLDASAEGHFFRIKITAELVWTALAAGQGRQE
jgi:hypothetical protein